MQEQFRYKKEIL